MNKQIAAEIGVAEIRRYTAAYHEEMAAKSLPDLVRMAQMLESARQPAGRKQV
jgi:FixJ family two-component response regulator